MKLESLLNKFFEYDRFRPGQKEVINSVLNGKHTLAMLPTGTGKSLCFHLPGYVLEGHVLIVSPLLSLMQDQVEQMKMQGEKRVIAINSFLSYRERQLAFFNIKKYKYIFISPEMLRVDKVILLLQELTISLYVIDEAHCISQWGYDFRPDYLKLGEIREKLNDPVTLALTATATKEVRQDIMNNLGIGDWEEIVYSVDRPNISIVVEKIPNHNLKLERLYEIIKDLNGPGIVYFSSKRLAERTVTFLQAQGMRKVNAYHGGMDQEQRILVQQQFINGQLDIICATSAFGMGINKENIRFIIHYHLPLQIESYLQEIGRAGRDGGKAIAILLYAPGDEALAYQLSEGELPAKEQIDMLASLFKETNLKSFSFNGNEEWRSRAGLSEVQWRIVMTYLNMTDSQIEDPITALKNFIETRLAYKRSKISLMMELIHSESCRRKTIINYFGEEANLETQIENCCDCCGIDKNIFIKKTLEQQEEYENFQWKSYLSAILLNK